MTGEMGWDDLREYPTMLALAKKIQSDVKVAAQLRPYDVYQGPFIAVDMDNAPVRNAQKARFGSWNFSIWYDGANRRFIINRGGKTIDGLTGAGVINYLKLTKKTWRK